MRILMVAPEPFFEPRGTPFSVYHRARALAALGHAVDLVTYAIGADVTLPGVRIYRAPRIPFLRRVKIGPSLAKFPLDALLFVTVVWRLLARRYDCIHTHEEAGLFGVLLGPLFRLPHVYDMHSQLSQQLINFNFTRSYGLVALMRWIERAIVRSACLVIVICPELEVVVRRIAACKPTVVIENTAVTSDLGTADQLPARASIVRLRDKLGLAAGVGPVLLYTGTFEPYQGLDLLIDSIPNVLDAFPGVVYVMVGGRPEQIDAAGRWADARGVRAAVRLLGQRPPEEMPALMALADVLVSPRSAGTNTPLKLYSYLYAGKPILATNIRSHTQVLSTAVAVLVEPTSTGLAGGARTLLGDAALRRRLGENAQQLATARYSEAVFLGKTADAYAQVMVRRKRRESAA